MSADGKILVVGANQESMTRRPGARPSLESGAVHVFGQTGDSWERQAHFIAPSVDSEDLFGKAVALSADGTLLAVAAIGENSGAGGVDGDAGDNSVESAGAVYLFRRDSPDHWTQIAYLKAADPAEMDYFGWSVDLDASGQTVAVGAWGQDGGGVDAGAVFVFGSDSEGRWTQQALLRTPKPRRGDAFGYTLALSADGRVLTVGAPGGGDNPADAGTGVAYVFSSIAVGQWELSGELHAAELRMGDAFGLEVAIRADGEVIAVAAQRVSTEEPLEAVYLFGRESDASWRPITRLSVPTENAAFGTSLDFDAKGETLIVGAPRDGMSAPGAGGAYVFRAGSEGRWAESMFIPPQNARQYWFGQVSLVSADGRSFVISAPRETVTVTNADGTREEWEAAGAVYVFDDEPAE